MSLFFQQILAAVLVVSAVGYIAIHYFRKQKIKSGCGACRALEAVKSKSATAHERGKLV